MSRQSEPVILKVGMIAEYYALDPLIDDCRALLLSWKAKYPSSSGKEADAVVAILSLERDCIERRDYILRSWKQMKLPF